MELLLSALALIMCKKVPTDLGIAKIDNLHNKIKLLQPPIVAQKPQGAVVRLTKALRPNSASKSDEDHQLIGIDQDHRAVAMNSRPEKLAYIVPVINQ